MKRIKLIIAIVFLVNFTAGAQFLYSLGIGAGINYGKEGWNEERYASQEHNIMKYHAAILAEFFSDPVFKWRAEVMYNMLGTKQYYLQGQSVNTTNFISLNNYLVYRHEFFKWIPYLLIGPRVEYLMSRGGIYGDVIGGEYSYHVTGAVGLGLQPVWFSHFKIFAEVFYNHDIMPSFIGTISSLNPNFTPTPQLSEVIMKHDWELRIGVKYVFDGKSKCPAVDNNKSSMAIILIILNSH